METGSEQDLMAAVTDIGPIRYYVSRGVNMSLCVANIFFSVLLWMQHP